MRGAQQRESTDDRLHAGPLTRRVAVEAQDRARHVTPQQFDLRFGQRGSHWCHGFVDPGRRQSDNVHIAFDHENAVGLARGGRGAIEIEEQPTLVEQRCVRRVQVFGRIWLRLGIEDAPAEPDDAAAHIPDRQHQTPAKSVVRFLTIDGDTQACIDQHRFLDRRQSSGQRLPRIGRETEAECLRQLLGNAARFQIVASCRAI